MLSRGEVSRSLPLSPLVLASLTCEESSLVMINRDCPSFIFGGEAFADVERKTAATSCASDCISKPAAAPRSEREEVEATSDKSTFRGVSRAVTLPFRWTWPGIACAPAVGRRTGTRGLEFLLSNCRMGVRGDDVEAKADMFPSESRWRTVFKLLDGDSVPGSSALMPVYGRSLY